MISVIIPIYNEAETLCALYERTSETLSLLGCAWEIVLVNDGSTDGSEAVLDQLAANDKRVKVAHFRRNFGQTAAMMAGIDFAEGDIIIPMDGDLQNDPADIPRLIDALESGYDVVSGWRREREDARLTRTIPSQVANWLISRVLGVHLRDYGCSLKAYRRDVIKDVKLYGEMHRFIPAYASWQGARVTEIPVSHHPRRCGQSKYGLERTLKVVLDLIVVKFLAKYYQKPMYVFGAFALACFGLTALLGVWAVYLKLADGISLILTPLPLAGVTTALMGGMCILMGLLAEVLTRTYHESQDKAIYLLKETRNIDLPVVRARPAPAAR